MNDLFKNIPFEDSEREARLWNYIDGVCEASEKSVIEKLVAENHTWRIKYKELLELHQLVQSSELEEPSLRFTKNVMEEISRLYIAPAAKTYLNKKVIWGIAAFFITIIAGFLIYAIAQVNWSEETSDTGFGIDFTKIEFGKMFNNNFVNVFMMLNVLLGLVFFDRYLTNKRNKFIEKS